jgi:tetratricopeptide (TPR) repeat protein
MVEAPGEKFCLHVRGPLHGVTRQRLAALTAAAGGCLAATPSARVNLLCFAHSTAAKSLSEGTVIELPPRVPRGCRVVSELTLKRLIGLAPPLPPENRTLGAAELAQRARLPLETVRCLALYDVVEPADDAFGYRDLLAAREVARLLKAELPLSAIVQAAIALRRSGRTLSDTRLSEAPWGEVLQEVAGRFARLDGQFTLPLAESLETLDEVFERAEEMERKGNLEEAERLYRLAVRIDRTDPVLPFNLGNVLDAQHRRAEAALAYQQAIARDPGFAEAWLNLGLLRESAGEVRAATDCYYSALAARSDYADALFNLALLLTRDEQYEAALSLWDRFLDLTPGGKEAPQARRLATLCRMHVKPGPGAGRSPCGEGSATS